MRLPENWQPSVNASSGKDQAQLNSLHVDDGADLQSDTYVKKDSDQLQKVANSNKQSQPPDGWVLNKWNIFYTPFRMPACIATWDM